MQIPEALKKKEKRKKKIEAAIKIAINEELVKLSSDLLKILEISGQ